MSRPTLIEVPYHLGRPEGPATEGTRVLSATLADDGVRVITVEQPDATWNEIADSFAVVRALADAVRGADLPVVLAANCNSCLGTVSGIGSGVGVVWFDAHDDFNTPDTTATGFLDGMGLALLTGAGWPRLREGIATVPEEHVVHVGARDLDATERERLQHSAIRVARRPPLDDALDELRTRVDAVYVHIDLDVLDPSVGRANSLAADDGLLTDEHADAIDAIASRFEIRAAAFTWYDPTCDPEGRIPPAVRTVYDRLLAARGVAA